MLLFHREHQNNTLLTDRSMQNGLSVKIYKQTPSNWKVSVESTGPLELFQGIRSREEAEIIAGRLYRKYEFFDVIIQVEK